MSSTKQLLQMLGMACMREKELWHPFSYVVEQNIKMEIGTENRDKSVRWMTNLSKKLKFHPETLTSSIFVFDKFLNSVKAHPKYLKIIALTCLYLSAKSIEEDQLVPCTLDLIRISQCGCSVAEVLRMERVILDKLDWDLRAVTPLEYLQIFYSLLMKKYPEVWNGRQQTIEANQMNVLTRKLILCSAYHGILSFSPATIALTILSQELEYFYDDWFSVTTALQSLVQVDSDCLILCREKIAFFYGSINNQSQNASLKISVPQLKPKKPLLSYAAVVALSSTKPTKRKVIELDDSSDDDVYDALKRLYNEDEKKEKIALSPRAVIATSCSSELLQETARNTQALQTVMH